jgi:hypothetical protein
MMTMTDNPAATPTPEEPAPQVLKGALKAFKKRLKVMRLDKESGKITGPLSSGRSSGIVAITPPSQFPPAVWAALVKQGKLRDAGYGTYELVDDNL